MMQEMMFYYEQFMELSKANPIVASALTIFVSGGLIYYVKEIPGKIWKFLIRQITTTMTFNNSGWHGGKREFASFLKWYLTSPYSKYSRTLSLDSVYFQGRDDSLVIGAGFGFHIFIYKGNLFWFNKNRLESSGSELEKMEVELTVLGRSHIPLLNLVEDFKFKKEKDKLYMETYKDNEWGNSKELIKRPLETVIINKNVKNKLITDIDNWMNNEEWYRERFIPYKLTIVLEGPPGTGKTSLIKAIATHTDRDIYTINLNEMSDKTLLSAINEVLKGNLIAIEDFDSAKATHSRFEQQEIDMPNISKEADNEFSFLTTAGFLNTLDGLLSLDNTLIVMTTNCIDIIDPAIIRKGRTDHIVNIGLLETEEIYDYIDLVFPENDLRKDIIFKPVAGCDLQAAFLEFPKDLEAFINFLPKETNK